MSQTGTAAPESGPAIQHRNRFKVVQLSQADQELLVFALGEYRLRQLQAWQSAREHALPAAHAGIDMTAFGIPLIVDLIDRLLTEGQSIVIGLFDQDQPT
jgi:hypothetical protein